MPEKPAHGPVGMPDSLRLEQLQAQPQVVRVDLELADQGLLMTAQQRPIQLFLATGCSEARPDSPLPGKAPRWKNSAQSRGTQQHRKQMLQPASRLGQLLSWKTLD